MDLCLHHSITLFQENQLKKLTGLNLTAVPDDATRSMATKQVARLMYLIMMPAACTLNVAMFLPFLSCVACNMCREH